MSLSMGFTPVWTKYLRLDSTMSTPYPVIAKSAPELANEPIVTGPASGTTAGPQTIAKSLSQSLVGVLCV